MIRVELTREQASMIVQMLAFASEHGLRLSEKRKALKILDVLSEAILAQEPNPS